jgi:hypothetical protein
MLGLVAVGVGVYSSRSPNAPTGQAPDKAAPAPPVAQAGPAGGTITVEGEGLSAWEKQALAEGFRKILSDAVHEAVKKGIEDLFRELRITDDLERKLLAAADFRPGPDAGPEPDPEHPFVWAIHLTRPGPADLPPETIEVTGQKPMTLRLTRALAAVERPVAVATLTWVREGQLRQREKTLVYGADGEWRATETIVAPDHRPSK